MTQQVLTIHAVVLERCLHYARPDEFLCFTELLNGDTCEKGGL